LLLIVASTSFAQTARSHKMRIYKKQIGIYNESKLYTWFQITQERNYEKALDQQIDTLIYGNEKFTKSEQQMTQFFFLRT
jgi:hypothetical protein